MQDQWRAGALGLFLLLFPLTLGAVEPSPASTPDKAVEKSAASATAATYADLTQLTAFFLCGNQSTTCDKAKVAKSVILNCSALKNQIGGVPVTPIQIEKLMNSYPRVADGLQIAAWTCAAEHFYFEEMGLKPGDKIPLKDMQALAMKMSSGKVLATAVQPMPGCDKPTSAGEAKSPLSCPLPGSKGPVGGPPAGGGPAPVDPMRRGGMEGGSGSGGMIQPSDIRQVPPYLDGKCFGLDLTKVFKGNSTPAAAPTADAPKPTPTPTPTPTPAPAPAPAPSTPLPPVPEGGLPTSGGGLGDVFKAIKELKGSDLGKSLDATFKNGMPTMIFTWQFLPDPNADAIVKECRDQFTANQAGCLGAGGHTPEPSGGWMCGVGGPQSSYVADTAGGGTAMPDPEGAGGFGCACEGGGKSNDGKDSKKAGGPGGEDCCPDYCKTAGESTPDGICNICSGSCSNAPSGGNGSTLVEDCLSGKAMSNPALAAQCAIINPSPLQKTIQPIYRMEMRGSFIEQWTTPRRGSPARGQSSPRTPYP